MKGKYLSLTLLFQLLILTAAMAQQSFFSNINENEIPNKEFKRVIKPSKYKTVALNFNGLKTFLSTLPDEKNVTDVNNTPVLELPMPDGSTAKFHVWQSLIMEQGLAEALPNIKTYLGQGITDKYATMRFDVTELGFHAMVLSSASGSIFIDPYNQNTTTHYISYYKKDFYKQVNFKEKLLKKGSSVGAGGSTSKQFPAGQCNGAQLRKYRLAVTCNNEYAKAATGLSNPTKAQVMSAITTTVNRVTGVYESEISVRLILIANNLNIVYNAIAGDPYYPHNDDPDYLINASQTKITAIIGSANFDIGHIFSTGGGGQAWLGGVCDNTQKAGAVTGQPNPVGDPYDIDFVAHEMGHQFGADHTFNANTGYCEGNAAYYPSQPYFLNCEPGSGTTIMAYAGICDANDLQPHSDPQFHAVSLTEILDFTILGNGNNCAVVSNTNNLPPVVNAGSDYTIPINTPFILTGTATDPNNDPLTYSWEQIDVGGDTGNWNKPQTVKIPLFRSFAPKTTGIRYFPQLSDVINGTTTIGERLPSLTRSLNFRLTARDNKAGGGGTCFDDVLLTVNSSGGAFKVTSQSSFVTWYDGETKTITWNKGNTNITPFNVANVAIELSTDGGNTFPVTLLASTPNDGTEDIVVPLNLTNIARVRVRALGNIFYSMNSVNFKIDKNLPVKWISFTAIKTESKVKLNWEAAEMNNQFYEVERSVDGKNFEKINRVEVLNTNAVTNVYTSFDNQPNTGKNYYRIKQVDKDGKYSYSDVVMILFEKGNNGFTMYPNPSKEIVNVYSSSNASNVSIQLFDAIGRVVFVKHIQQLNAGENITINTSSFSKGVYSLSVQKGNNEIEIKKLIVE